MRANQNGVDTTYSIQRACSKRRSSDRRILHTDQLTGMMRSYWEIGMSGVQSFSNASAGRRVIVIPHGLYGSSIPKPLDYFLFKRATITTHVVDLVSVLQPKCVAQLFGFDLCK